MYGSATDSNRLTFVTNVASRLQTVLLRNMQLGADFLKENLASAGLERSYTSQTFCEQSIDIWLWR